MLPPSSRLRASQQNPWKAHLETSTTNIHHIRTTHQVNFPYRAHFSLPPTPAPALTAPPRVRSPLREGKTLPRRGPALPKPAQHARFVPPCSETPSPRFILPQRRARGTCPGSSRLLKGLQPPSQGARGRLRAPRPQRRSRLRAGRARPRPFWVRARRNTSRPSLPEGGAAPRWRRCQYPPWRLSPGMPPE